MSFGEDRLAQAPARRRASGERRRSVLVRHSCSSLTYKYHLRMLPVTARACAEDSTRLVDCDVDWILRSPGAPHVRSSSPRCSAFFPRQVFDNAKSRTLPLSDDCRRLPWQVAQLLQYQARHRSRSRRHMHLASDCGALAARAASFRDQACQSLCFCLPLLRRRYTFAGSVCMSTVGDSLVMSLASPCAYPHCETRHCMLH